MSEFVCDKVLIGGAWVPAERGTYPIVDPSTEGVAGRAPECSVAQVEAAARAAREAFEKGPWPRMTGAERGALLAKAAAAFRAAMGSLVEVTIAETGAVRGVALAIKEASAKRLKRTLLELGGKSPQIVFADAPREAALKGATQVWTFHSGQICIAGTRLLVERSIYDEFTRAMVEIAGRIKV